MRKGEDKIPQTLTEAVAHLMALPVSALDNFSPRTVAEKIAIQIIRDAAKGNSDSMTAVIRIALNEKSKARPNQTKITLVED